MVVLTRPQAVVIVDMGSMLKDVDELKGLLIQ